MALRILIRLFFVSCLMLVYGSQALAFSFESHEPPQISFSQKNANHLHKIDPSLQQIQQHWQKKMPITGVSPRAQIKKNRVQVTVILDAIQKENLKELEKTGLEIQHIISRNNHVQGWIHPQYLSGLQDLNFVKRVQLPSYAQFNQGSVATEGDEMLQTDTVRSVANLTGKGVRIGVISSGVAGIFESVASQDLPSGSDQSCDPDAIKTSGVHCQAFADFGIDYTGEGTAMLEIIHDLAPDAELYFANAYTSDEFILALDYLAGKEEDGGAGVDVIVDDVAMFTQPFFEDGDVAERVRELVDDGMIYVTAAGNSATSHLQENYRDTDHDGWHEFQTGKESYGVVVGPGGSLIASLQWSDEFDNPNTDLDLYAYFYDSQGRYVTSVESSVENASGAWPALELLEINNPGNETYVGYFYIHRSHGTDDDLQIEFFASGSDENEYYETSDSIFGHAAVDGVLAIGAVDQVHSNQGPIEDFSSQGPASVSNESGAKPDFVASDGVSITGAGDFSSPFYGTSAAGPHVAGCLALLLEADLSLNANDLNEILQRTALDLGDEGFDSIYGYGFVDCAQAVSEVTGLDMPELSRDSGDENASNQLGFPSCALNASNHSSEVDSKLIPILLGLLVLILWIQRKYSITNLAMNAPCAFNASVSTSPNSVHGDKRSFQRSSGM